MVDILDLLKKISEYSGNASEAQVDELDLFFNNREVLSPEKRAELSTIITDFFNNYVKPHPDFKKNSLTRKRMKNMLDDIFDEYTASSNRKTMDEMLYDIFNKSQAELKKYEARSDISGIYTVGSKDSPGTVTIIKKGDTYLLQSDDLWKGEGVVESNIYRGKYKYLDGRGEGEHVFIISDDKSQLRGFWHNKKGDHGKLVWVKKEDLPSLEKVIDLTGRYYINEPGSKDMVRFEPKGNNEYDLACNQGWRGKGRLIGNVYRGWFEYKGRQKGDHLMLVTEDGAKLKGIWRHDEEGYGEITWIKADAPLDATDLSGDYYAYHVGSNEVIKIRKQGDIYTVEAPQWTGTGRLIDGDVFKTEYKYKNGMFAGYHLMRLSKDKKEFKGTWNHSQGSTGEVNWVKN